MKKPPFPCRASPMRGGKGLPCPRRASWGGRGMRGLLPRDELGSAEMPPGSSSFRAFGLGGALYIHQ